MKQSSDDFVVASVAVLRRRNAEDENVRQFLLKQVKKLTSKGERSDMFAAKTTMNCDEMKRRDSFDLFDESSAAGSVGQLP